MNLENIYDFDWDDDGSAMYDEIELDDLVDEIQISEVI